MVFVPHELSLEIVNGCVIQFSESISRNTSTDSTDVATNILQKNIKTLQF